jgi:hypothetical protein
MNLLLQSLLLVNNKIKALCLMAIAFGLCINQAHAQLNLVVNGGFEPYSACPDEGTSSTWQQARIP